MNADGRGLNVLRRDAKTQREKGNDGMINTEVRKRQKVRRLEGEKDDYENICLFYASDSEAYLTGSAQNSRSWPMKTSIQ